MKIYQYRALEASNIRLIQLLPGKLGDPIRVCIIHTKLDPQSESPPLSKPFPVDEYKAFLPSPWTIEELENGDVVIFNVASGETRDLRAAQTKPLNIVAIHPEFEALSYTWGDAVISESCYIDGLFEESKSPSILGLRPNLAAALRHLRYLDRIRTLWVDAICINQEDLDERNVQVKKMTQIYSLASKVIAWLGEESQNSKHAFTTLHRMGQQLQSTRSGRLISTSNALEPQLWRNDKRLHFDDWTWQSLQNLVTREWFYRVWCWQEIKLGSYNAVIQCGTNTIPWKKFWLAILCLNNKNWLPSMLFRERCRHIVFLQHSPGTHPMNNILDVCRSKGCTDPRDKIYGLLGMTPASFTGKIMVDYRQPVEETYKSAFLVYTQITRRLELLKHCNLGKRTIGGPSWVPDWSLTEFSAPLLSEQLSAGMSRAWFTIVEPNTLQVIGKRHSAIQAVSGIASSLEDQTLLAVKDWMKILPPDLYYVTGERMDVAFALTLCMNRSRERHPYIHTPSASEWVSLVREVVSLVDDPSKSTLYSSREIAGTVQKLRGRRFFVTETGHIGTAPAATKIGDIICLILGTYAPLVLRETQDGHFLVVGECYIHGLSDGVGLLGPLPDHWNVIVRGDALGLQTQIFTSDKDDRGILDDPRLGTLPENWERVVFERTPDDPSIFQWFRNSETNELINSDPRWNPKMLELRGVTLETFALV